MKKILLSIMLLELAVISILFGDISRRWERAKIATTKYIVSLREIEYVIRKDKELKYFYEPKPHTVQESSEEWLPDKAVYTINADGLNERSDYPVENPVKTFRIMTLGDSFTFGQYVDTEENYPEKLEDLLNRKLPCADIKKFEVINLGVPGYDPEYSAHRFKTRGQKYEPDLLLWFIPDNDFSTINEQMWKKMNYYNFKLRLSGVKDTHYVNGEYFPAYRKAVDDLLREYGAKGIMDYQYRQLINVLNLFSRPIVFLIPPAMPDEYLDLLQGLPKLRENVHLLNLDNYDVLVDGHPNAKGYTQIAQQLFDYLTREKFIPCN